MENRVRKGLNLITDHRTSFSPTLHPCATPCFHTQCHALSKQRLSSALASAIPTSASHCMSLWTRACRNFQVKDTLSGEHARNPFRNQLGTLARELANISQQYVFKRLQCFWWKLIFLAKEYQFTQWVNSAFQSNRFHDAIFDKQNSLERNEVKGSQEFYLQNCSSVRMWFDYHPLLTSMFQ